MEYYLGIILAVIAVSAEAKTEPMQDGEIICFKLMVFVWKSNH